VLPSWSDVASVVNNIHASGGVVNRFDGNRQVVHTIPMYVPGDTLVNASNGGKGTENHRINQPLEDFTSHDKNHVYYRWTGKKHRPNSQQ